jgi:hypothetical protein
MGKATDKQYEKIIEEFIAKMDSVKAPIADYRAALRDARGQIDMALDASEVSVKGDDR